MTHSLALRVCSTNNFNSHAHVERDIQMLIYISTVKISTHTLTWSVTFVEFSNPALIEISTHTLTWSVTDDVTQASILKTNFNSHAHVERDA